MMSANDHAVNADRALNTSHQVSLYAHYLWCLDLLARRNGGRRFRGDALLAARLARDTYTGPVAS
jgi:hypothetical protein